MAKKGRPLSDDPRKKTCRVRINNAENKMLEEICRMTGMKTSDVLRSAIELMYHDEYYKENFPLSPILDNKYKKED